MAGKAENIPEPDAPQPPTHSSSSSSSCLWFKVHQPLLWISRPPPSSNNTAVPSAWGSLRPGRCHGPRERTESRRLVSFRTLLGLFVCPLGRGRVASTTFKKWHAYTHHQPRVVAAWNQPQLLSVFTKSGHIIALDSDTLDFSTDFLFFPFFFMAKVALETFKCPWRIHATVPIACELPRPVAWKSQTRVGLSQ